MKARAPILAPLASLVVAVGMWLVFAPAQLGGSTTYSVTDGISMQPLLHKGDLAVERSSSSYRVGDIVLYRSPSLHTTVLHRIIVIQNGRYYFKGDNNSFVDPGYVTDRALVGKLWFHVPHAGAVISWFARPLHAAIIIALAVFFLGAGSLTRTARRRRTGRPRAKKQGFQRPTIHDLHGTVGKIFASIVGLFVLAAILLTVGFTTPAHRSVIVSGAYRHTGSFDYAARTVRPNAAYPTGLAVTGQPLFLDLFKNEMLRFTYRFESREPHHVHGTISMYAFLSSEATSWHNHYALVPLTKFQGDQTTISGVVDLAALRTFILQLAQTSGAVGGDLSISVRPVVHVYGSVGGQPLNETFSPMLLATATQSVLRLDPSTPTAPPGATYATPTTGDLVAAALNPVQEGKTRQAAVNDVTFARYQLPVPLLRLLGLVALALAAIGAVIHHERLGRHIEQPLEDRIAQRIGSVVVPVAALQDAESKTVEVPEFARLAGLADYLERPILTETRDGIRLFAVDDGTLRYIHRAPVVEKREADAPAPAEEAPSPTVFPTKPVRLRLARIAGLLLVVGIAVTLATTFTATNTVPPSKVGRTIQALALSQLAPAECSGISLTHLMVATTSTTSGTNADDLILGRGTAGVFTLTGNGGTDCLVAGGGASTYNTLNGGYTDICLAPAAAHNTYSKCTNH